MKERLRTIFHRMIYGPVDRRFYSDNAVLLDRYNFSVLRVVCVCVALVDILYSVFSLFATSRPIVSVTFLCFTGAFVVLWLLVWILVSKKPSLTRLFYYLIYALIYSQTLVLSTVFSPASRMVVVFLVIIMSFMEIQSSRMPSSRSSAVPDVSPRTAKAETKTAPLTSSVIGQEAGIFAPQCLQRPLWKR